MPGYDYDLAIIGSGPAGQRTAIQAAELGKRTVILEKSPRIGGINIYAGTVSKTMRDAVLYLTGYRERNIYGQSYAVKQNITMDDLMVRTRYVIQQQSDILQSQLAHNRVETIIGEGSFVDRHTLKVKSEENRTERTITSDKVAIAVGSYSTEPPVVYADGRLVFVSDHMLSLPKLPRTLTIVGAGAIGLEYTSTFAALGTRVTLVDRNHRLLTFADEELADTLAFHMRQTGVTLRLSEVVFDIDYMRDEVGDRVRVQLESGKQIISDAVMYCVGRTGCTASLNLQAIGLEADARGRLSVDENYQTKVEGVYAVGGVIGFPDLVSTSRMQGRLAARHAFGIERSEFQELLPYTIKTIPEVAMVGKTEDELNETGVPFEVGKARYRETESSLMRGDDVGFLKLLFHLKTRQLLGVHIVGENAAELIHIGQAVIAYDGTIDYFVESVIGYPTLAEAYTTAALDGIRRLGGY
ncbi:MAG: Si-specific NAD(P)(+) transhydrogenase [Acidimicrobiia bacterium]|nr:Si-specific NAD(P)(+) transhydrogenase [Acidimicrobiia bacterium]MYB46072.1 Si-specific NAD(P)(+) transhydrogenase [Acidimicrobiia bacterium]